MQCERVARCGDVLDVNAICDMCDVYVDMCMYDGLCICMYDVYHDYNVCVECDVYAIYIVCVSECVCIYMCMRICINL